MMQPKQRRQCYFIIIIIRETGRRGGVRTIQGAQTFETPRKGENLDEVNENQVTRQRGKCNRELKNMSTRNKGKKIKRSRRNT